MIPEAAAEGTEVDPTAANQATDADKLRMIRDTVESQSPYGSELANFRRRLRLILDMQ